ncbi:ABATE domain-containing protein [Streptomyces lincolnensis]|uniref:BTAD domain-containing putative transcriptional regulator n=1 Tax=Streptomyces lincolnensis TaxID=1915 RepID=UPI001E4BC3F3|nr:BTAD domain-containing putative transcriptional regulator [Streptomyces lincolnensis]MCD7437350.1 ABATE domain-containing protein [Streptomyces lincolnensis]
MEFRLLGPFDARHDGQPMLVGSRRQERCMLAILLLHAGHTVTTARLIDLLWNGAAPPSARGTVHTYVGRLRTALQPHGPRIHTRPDGYVVEADGHRIDAREFVRLVEQATAVGDPAERARLHDEALALWRGPLLADVADDRLRDRLGGRLDEMRLSTLEQWAESQLDMGRHERVAAELMATVQDHPERERLVAARMLALHRGGRQADALQLYRSTSRALATGFGVDPGAGLRTLHERVLRADPRLDRPPAPVYAARVGEEWLPWNTSGHPALEFCNTYAGWRGPRLPGSEWLRSYSTLAVWAGHLDLADDATVARLLDRARRHPEEAAEALDEAREFRGHLYTCLTDPDDGGAFKAVAAVVEDAVKASVFTRDEDGLARWLPSRTDDLRLPVRAVARSAADLLADPRRFTIRACPGESCGWLFLDRRGRRRWCSLATCGGEESARAACVAAGVARADGRISR